jgi:hypothetical protein
MAHQGQYPVIFLTFKNIKASNWLSCLIQLKSIIAKEHRRHDYLLDSDVLNEGEKEKFRRIMDETAIQEEYQSSLENLTKYLHVFHNQKPIILIDEYDAPIHAGFLNKYYEETIVFMRGLLCGGLKDNSNLAYGVLTGILRVARESIFSGMNNLDVHSLLSPFYADHFGFSQAEVETLITQYKIRKTLDEVRSWYNGYAIGGVPLDETSDDPYTIKIYNPWSMLKFIQSRGSFGIYWVNTSDNKLIQDLIQRAPGHFKEEFQRILAGKTLRKTITEDTVFASLEIDSNALWSFLVFCGYLTWESRDPMQGKCGAELVVPNHEVLDCFATLIEQWFSQSSVNEIYQNMLKALVVGNVSLFKRDFKQCVLESFSYFDVGGNAPERVYQAYVLGMLVALNKTHAVLSNTEGGLGRYDVCIIPHDKTKIGTVIEFKVFDPEVDKTMENAAEKAIEQIEVNHYDAALTAHGVTNIIKLGIVFNKKDVLIVQGSCSN